MRFTPEDRDEHGTEAERAFRRAIRKEVRQIAAVQNPWVAAIAIIVLGAFGIFAVQQGIDGTIAMLLVAAIAGIAGYSLQRLRGRRLDQD